MVDNESLLGNEIVKNDVLLDYIRELKKSYKIGMLSNVANNWIRDYFLTEDEQALFDEMIMSFEVGMTKPDPRIFLLACDRLRVGPHEAVLVDDVEHELNEILSQA
jgi:putative hydrolase of the HAD superfamily